MVILTPIFIAPGGTGWFKWFPICSFPPTCPCGWNEGRGSYSLALIFLGAHTTIDAYTSWLFQFIAPEAKIVSWRDRTRAGSPAPLMWRRQRHFQTSWRSHEVMKRRNLSKGVLATWPGHLWNRKLKCDGIDLMYRSQSTLSTMTTNAVVSATVLCVVVRHLCLSLSVYY